MKHKNLADFKISGIRIGKHFRALRQMHARDHTRALRSSPWAPRAMPEDCDDECTRHVERRELTGEPRTRRA